MSFSRELSAAKRGFVPFTCAGIGSKLITVEQALSFLTQAQIDAGEARGSLKSFGPWQIPLSYRALACSCDFDAPGRPLTVHGVRTLSNVHQSGSFELEGRVSVAGKSYRGFTSSQLFELPTGKLVNVVIIHVCGLK